MRESSYYADIGKYYLKNPPPTTTTWEAKFTRTKYINFKCLAPHQEERLLQSERVFNYKIADSGVLQKPFDGACFVGARPVFIAIYYEPRNERVYEIPIRAFLKEKYESGKKSLSLERASEIGRLITL